jgi:hypothetical protein
MSNPSLQPYFVYDPNVGDELGGLRVYDGKDGRHILANPQMAQYWIDQGLLGTDPLSKLKDSSKKLLEQITRGRSKDPDAPLSRIPKYNKATQSGAAAYVGLSGLPPMSLKNRQETLKKDREEKQKQKEKEPRTPNTDPNK